MASAASIYIMLAKPPPSRKNPNHSLGMAQRTSAVQQTKPTQGSKAHSQPKPRMPLARSHPLLLSIASRFALLATLFVTFVRERTFISMADCQPILLIDAIVLRLRPLAAPPPATACVLRPLLSRSCWPVVRILFVSPLRWFCVVAFANAVSIASDSKQRVA